MKKIIIVVGLVSSLQFSYAQKGISNELPNRLFVEGKEMFDSKNFVGAENTLKEFKTLSGTSKLIIEADYMITVSAFYRGENNASETLRTFLDTYPETYHRNNIYFYLGSINFDKKDWDLAAYWFNQCNIDYLSAEDKEDYTYRNALTLLETGKRNDAYSLFGTLTSSSTKYKEASTYYRAYIDFYEGNYDKAISVFEVLQNVPEYKEQSMFFITQSFFLKKDLDKAINSGLNYLSIYPSSKNNTEIYRILGNSYYRQSDLPRSISFYEKYMPSTEHPLREDMYLLGIAYTSNNSIEKSIKALQYAAESNDQLGQAAYMMLGQNYLKLGDDRNALMAFEAASLMQYDTSISEAALYNYALLVHKTSLSLFDQSVNVLQRFLTEYPNSRYKDEVTKQLASTLLSTTNYKAALAVIDKMKAPSQPIMKAKQSILFQLGVENYINGDYETAKRYFDSCISMPDYDISSKNQAYFWKGESSYREQNYTSASSNYLQFLAGANRQTENYSEALYNLGYAYFNLKQYGQALNYFSKYTESEKSKNNKTYADALNRIGDCYLFDRNFSSAVQAYSLASSRGNNQSAEYAEFQKAFILGLQQNHNAKISVLNDMMAKYPSSIYYPDALFEKSKTLVTLNREVEAIPLLTQLLNNMPNASIAPQAGILLGQLYYNTNNTNAAIDTYKKIAQYYKNTQESRIAIQSLESIYRDLNDINSFVSFANSLGNGVVISATRQDSLTYLAAENVSMKGNNDQTVTAMQKYLQSFPKGQFAGDAHYYLGTVAYNKKDYQTALSEFSNTINSGSSRNLNKALSLAAQLELNNGNAKTADAYYNRLANLATTLNEKDLALAGLLKTSVLLNNYNETITTASLILSNEKSLPETINQAYLYRAKSYLNMKDNTKAIADLKKISVDTRNVYGAEAQFLLANTYLNDKKYDLSEKQVQSFIKQGTPHAYWMARAIIVLADSYQANGDNFSAKQYLESLKVNYTGKDKDIFEMIDNRLGNLNK